MGALRAVLVLVFAGTLFIQAGMVWALATNREEGSLPLTPLRAITIVGMVSVQVAGYACGWLLVAYGSDGRRAQSKPVERVDRVDCAVDLLREFLGRGR